ncbi:substrate-binding periplasmic protein [Paludibacterium purpuratum]|uniref:Amino acid ABC transporter substrate-binding protein (PAAT family) n=1 Tax=Paludibacterium purpuratum TaxID=1144873 RepID=A0A4V3DUE9_9NEIS|nr:transporter substrate-binding domain-containing protein [Paludibacterium purpuratum]TDR72517.1 amino acid ABC transporter substrate-binding protein (PAAT family) [Paludibacterium purpuratum]
MNKLHITGGLCLSLLPLLVLGQPTSLRIGVADSEGPPIAVIEQNTLKSGMSKDIGEALGQALARKVDFVIISRKRVESSLENGKVDIVCIANPVWYGDAGQLGWTREMFPLVERVAVLAGKPPVHSLGDLVGKRIGTIRGYSYPSLESMWANGKASRDTEDRLELVMKALLINVADAAIVSEQEYGVWAKANSETARQIRLSAFQFSSTPTMCAVSPQSHFSVDTLNRAIGRLQQQGKFKAILRSYQWQSE